MVYGDVSKCVSGFFLKARQVFTNTQLNYAHSNTHLDDGESGPWVFVDDPSVHKPFSFDNVSQETILCVQLRHVNIAAKVQTCSVVTEI